MPSFLFFKQLPHRSATVGSLRNRHIPEASSFACPPLSRQRAGDKTMPKRNGRSCMQQQNVGCISRRQRRQLMARARACVRILAASNTALALPIPNTPALKCANSTTAPPATIDPETGKRHFTDFPYHTIKCGKTQGFCEDFLLRDDFLWVFHDFSIKIGSFSPCADQNPPILTP